MVDGMMGKAGQSNIGGLTNLGFFYVIVVGDGKIKLASSASNANAGIAIDLTSQGGGDAHQLFEIITGVEIPAFVDFDPDAKRYELGDAGSLNTGDAVVASVSSIGGLSNGTTYYAIVKPNGNLELAASQADALSDKAITLNSVGTASLTEATHSFGAKSISGASGGDIGIAGSFAINIANTETLAVVGLDHDALTLAPTVLTLTGGNVNIRAENTNSSVVEARSKSSSGKVGVGAAIGVNISLNDTIAEIEDGERVIGSTGNFEVAADSSNLATTLTQAGAGGGTAIGGGISIAVVENTTRALIGSGDPLSPLDDAAIVLTGNLAAEATHASTVVTKADGEAAGGNVGVGISLALNILINDTDGEIARDFTGAANVDVTASSTVSATAESKAGAKGQSSKKSDGTSSKNSDQETADQTSYAKGKGGTTAAPTQTTSSAQSSANSNTSSQSGKDAKSGGTSVAATIAVNFVDVDTNATIRDGVSITATGA
ncbi:MAG: hypothetical protein IH853_13990, partial [Bacteroidetes bacterium]|nr:hypothetical protein [Bacteroidota bacterium]